MPWRDRMGRGFLGAGIACFVLAALVAAQGGISPSAAVDVRLRQVQVPQQVPVPQTRVDPGAVVEQAVDTVAPVTAPVQQAVQHATAPVQQSVEQVASAVPAAPPGVAVPKAPQATVPSAPSHSPEPSVPSVSGPSERPSGSSKSSMSSGSSAGRSGPSSSPESRPATSSTPADQSSASRSALAPRTDSTARSGHRGVATLWPPDDDALLPRTAEDRKRRAREVRRLVREHRACLSRLGPVERSVLILRAALGENRPRSLESVAGLVDAPAIRIARVERRAVREIRMALTAGRCGDAASNMRRLERGGPAGSGGAPATIFYGDGTLLADAGTPASGTAAGDGRGAGDAGTGADAGAGGSRSDGDGAGSDREAGWDIDGVFRLVAPPVGTSLSDALADAIGFILLGFALIGAAIIVMGVRRDWRGF